MFDLLMKTLIILLVFAVSAAVSCNAQAVFGFASQPSITSTLISNGVNPDFSILSATFNMSIGAQSDVHINLPSSASSAFAFSVYKNGAKDSTTPYEGIINYTQPTGTTLSGDGRYFTIAQNQSITIPVTFTFDTKDVFGNSNSFAVQIESISWFPDGSSMTIVDFGSNPGWRTTSIGGLGGLVNSTNEPAIPEPSTYSAIIGFAALGLAFVAKNRRKSVS